MGDQEQEFIQEDEDSICRAMHHLSTAASPSPPHTRTATTKRQLLPSFQEPPSKRPTLHPPQSPSITAAAASPPTLRRTVSEPVNYAVCSAAPPPQFWPEFRTSPGPEPKQPPQVNDSDKNTVQESFISPTAQPFIHCTLSDPNPLANLQVRPPSSPLPARNISWSPCSNEESPNTKRLKRMKERMKEMSEWWNVVVHESDDQEAEQKSIPSTSTAATSPPPLRRTVSEPINYADAVYSAAPPPQFWPEFPTSRSQQSKQPTQEVSGINTVQELVPLAKVQPFIRRTLSDPSPLGNLGVEAGGSRPPRSPIPARNVPWSLNCGESPNTKRLKRMKERMKVMREWWNEVVRESDEEEDSESENCEDDSTFKDEYKNPSQEEAVWVEKNGERLILHFKCPCGNGYQIMFSGNDCYYKLTHF